MSLRLSRTKAVIAVSIGAAASLTAIPLVPYDLLPASVVLAFALAWATVVDIDRFVLPDAITMGLILAGLGLSALIDRETIVDRAIGAAAGYASLVLVAYAYRLARKREGLGRGDAKLFAAGGAWLGWAALPNVMLVAATAALIAVIGLHLLGRLQHRDQPITFGPFLAIGIWAIWLASRSDFLRGPLRYVEMLATFV